MDIPIIATYLLLLLSCVVGILIGIVIGIVMCGNEPLEQ